MKRFFILIILCALFTGCTVTAGIDWHGKSEKSNTTETANYRNKGGKY